jgi:hypothetical protein
MATRTAKLWEKREPTTLDARVRSLRPEVDEAIRTGLIQLLQTVRRTKAPELAIASMNRLGLILVRKIYDDVGLPRPESDNLFKCIADIGPDARPVVPFAKPFLPSDIAQTWHLTRMMANRAGHVKDEVEGLRLDLKNAEFALSAYLNVLEWYYTQFEAGPRLEGIYSPQRAPIPWPILATAFGFITVVLVGFSLVGGVNLVDTLGDNKASRMQIKHQAGPLTELRSRVRQIEASITGEPVDKQKAMIQELGELIDKADKLDFQGYGSYWTALKEINSASLTKSDPIPAIHEAAEDLARAWALSGDGVHRDRDLQYDVQTYAKYLRKQTDQIQARVEQSNEAIADINKNLDPIVQEKL